MDPSRALLEKAYMSTRLDGGGSLLRGVHMDAIRAYMKGVHRADLEHFELNGASLREVLDFIQVKGQAGGHEGTRAILTLRVEGGDKMQV